MKSLPYWVKGGIIGVGFYVLSVLVSSLVLILPETFFTEQSYYVFIPFLVIVFHPAMLFTSNYEALWFIIPFNALFYFFVGMCIAKLVHTRKTYRSKS